MRLQPGLPLPFELGFVSEGVALDAGADRIIAAAVNADALRPAFVHAV